MNRNACARGAVASLVWIGSLAGVAAADIGYDDLVARLGGVGVPTGAGVNVVQTEAPESAGNYGPDLSDPEFAGVAFTPMSGPSGYSWHATTVGHFFYGDVSGIAPGIPGVWLYEASNFIGAGYLRNGQGAAVLPLTPPGGCRLFNHSWVGSTGSTSSNNEIIRRTDYAQSRDLTLFCVGVNNAPGALQPLLAFTYDGISVGLSNGAHSWGTVPAGYDGAGRMKPELVAPASATSWACGIVNSVAALLMETANTAPLDANPDADRGVVIKSVMMSGAAHRETWSNQPTMSGANRGIASKPLDPIYGADTVNIDRSHWILTSGEQEGSPAVPAAPTIGPRGWDYQLVGMSGISYYRFRVTQPVTDVSILVTWNRAFGGTIGAGTSGNQQLTLYKVAPGSTTLQSLTGDAGLTVFQNGNVVSQSGVDNVEHLYLHDLARGEYVIELKRIDASATAVQTAISWIMPETPESFADFNADGIVDGDDLGTLLGNWGPCTGCLPDLNEDGIVDGDDLGSLLGDWG